LHQCCCRSWYAELSAAVAAFAVAQNANNVLVSSCEASPNGLVAKLADLGLSRVINQHRTHRTTHTVRRRTYPSSAAFF
jgi:hypothetical protein